MRGSTAWVENSTHTLIVPDTQIHYTIGAEESRCTGTLTTQLISPDNNFEVQRNRTFTIKVNTTCTGGCCGTVTAIADPKVSASPIPAPQNPLFIQIFIPFLLGVVATLFVIKIKGLK